MRLQTFYFVAEHWFAVCDLMLMLHRTHWKHMVTPEKKMNE